MDTGQKFIEDAAAVIGQMAEWAPEENLSRLNRAIEQIESFRNAMERLHAETEAEYLRKQESSAPYDKQFAQAAEHVE